MHGFSSAPCPNPCNYHTNFTADRKRPLTKDRPRDRALPVPPPVYRAARRPGGQQEGQGIRHRLRPDKTRLMEDRAEDEHRRNVDQPLTEDIENLSRKETATISRYFGRKLALWTIPCYRLT